MSPRTLLLVILVVSITILVNAAFEIDLRRFEHVPIKEESLDGSSLSGPVLQSLEAAFGSSETLQKFSVKGVV